MKSPRKKDFLRSTGLMLYAMTVLCLVFAGVSTYFANMTTKEQLVATKLHATFPNAKSEVYAVGYAKDDWAQINFRGTVSLIAIRGNGDDKLEIGCMIEPNEFAPMAAPKLYALFTKLQRCPTNKEVAALQ